MIPIDKDQIEHFTPESLENFSPKPVFRFRAATARDQQRYNHQLSLEGLRLHDDSAVRDEIKRVLKQNWDETTYNEAVQRLETTWALIDQSLPVTDEDLTAIAELIGRCMDVSPMLRRMDADNKAFAENAPAMALGLFLVGWKNIDLPFRLEANVIPFDTLLELSRELRKIEAQASEEKVEGAYEGLAFLQLTLKGFQLLSLNKAEEKNLSAPSRSSRTRSGSKKMTKRAGASANGRSAPKKIPAE